MTTLSAIAMDPTPAVSDPALALTDVLALRSFVANEPGRVGGARPCDVLREGTVVQEAEDIRLIIGNSNSHE